MKRKRARIAKTAYCLIGARRSTPPANTSPQVESSFNLDSDVSLNLYNKNSRPLTQPYHVYLAVFLDVYEAGKKHELCRRLFYDFYIYIYIYN